MDAHDAGRALGALLNLLCCCGLPLAAVSLVVWLLVRKRPSPATAGAAAAQAAAGGALAIPTPDASWGTHRCPSVGLQLQAPRGVLVQEVADQVRIVLPSGYDYRLARGDLSKIAERRRWLETTPYRTKKQVLLAAPDAFVYSAQEGDTPDLSFVAGKQVGAATWLVETHGAIIDGTDAAAKVRTLSLADLAHGVALVRSLRPL